MILKPLAILIGIIGSSTFALGVEAPKLFETLQPSIVLISNAEGIGSGIVISPDGLILTNLHVASSPLALSVRATVEQHGKRVERTFDGLHLYKAHEQDDLALLKIDAADCRFFPARLAKAEADVKAGDVCYALGFPFLAGQTRSDLTITRGLINSTHREIQGKSYLQIDAAIMPGNSGGALVKEDGLVVGIPTLRYVGEDRVSLAIPVSSIRMRDFSEPSARKGNVAEAERLEGMANGYLARDVFSSEGDSASAAAALQLLREAQTKDPSNAHRSYLVSETYRRLGMLQPARAYAENAVKLDPSSFTFRIALATISDGLRDVEGALDNYLACIPLIDAKTGKSEQTQLFQKLIDLLEKRREALRTLYLISWSKAVLGGQLSVDEQLKIKRISRVIPEDLVRSILDMKSGHALGEMRKLAAAHPQQIAENASDNLPPVEVSSVEGKPVQNPVIVSKVNIGKGDSARLVDAPAGMVYHAEKGLLEWTPPPFSADTETRVLFLLTHPDGKEETLVHIFKREP